MIQISGNKISLPYPAGHVPPEAGLPENPQMPKDVLYNKNKDPECKIYKTGLWEAITSAGLRLPGYSLYPDWQ